MKCSNGIIIKQSEKIISIVQRNDGIIFKIGDKVKFFNHTEYIQKFTIYKSDYKIIAHPGTVNTLSIYIDYLVLVLTLDKFL